jgi:alpha-glucosidase
MGAVSPPPDTPWWRDAVVYQVYPRSFQDSDGDGVGDLPGIAARLDHVADLGADAVWLSPVYPSPMADGGYDVADYTDIDPRFGTLADADALVGAAHARGLRLLMDVVPCHTSIEHPWFREHPERYVWADGDAPPNNWIASFGGPAWSRDPRTGRWYLHSFYPEQPDLDWRRDDVREAMAAALRFWVDRGVDGFRLDALNCVLKDPELRDDPPATTPFGLPLPEEYGRLAHVHSANSPEVGQALGAMREAAGEAALVGEVYLPARDHRPYLEHLDATFSFELFHAPWEAGALRRAIESSAGGAAWVLSNHDFPRVPTRVGAENARAAAVLLLTLPGPAFVYQGEELGQADAPGPGTRWDRHGRDGCRTPVQWDPEPRTAGFTDGVPWLDPVDPAERNARDQDGDPQSMLALYRQLIALRAELGEGLAMLDAEEGVVAFRRGEHVVAVNTTSEPARLPAPGTVVVSTHPGAGDAGTLAPHEGRVVG